MRKTKEAWLDAGKSHIQYLNENQKEVSEKDQWCTKIEYKRWRPVYILADLGIGSLCRVWHRDAIIPNHKTSVVSKEFVRFENPNNS